MADGTGIEWTDATWQATHGCSIVSPGCTNCYAMKMASRLERMGQAAYTGLTQQTKAGAVWNGNVRAASDHALTQPMRWKKPRRIFVDSMADLFAEDVEDAWINRAFAIMALCPQHTFQVLTKRPERMRDYIGTRSGDWQIVLPDAFPPGTLPITQNDVHRHIGQVAKFSYDPPTPAWPLQNVWLGTSVEDQQRADERIPHLLATPAAIRFLSCEPLLGEIDLTSIPTSHREQVADTPHSVWRTVSALTGESGHGSTLGPTWTGRKGAHIDLVIAGGESGPNRRRVNLDHMRSLRDQCAIAGVAFFGKQDDKVHDLPLDLLIRQMPGDPI